MVGSIFDQHAKLCAIRHSLSAQPSTILSMTIRFYFAATHNNVSYLYKQTLPAFSTRPIHSISPFIGAIGLRPQVPSSNYLDYFFSFLNNVAVLDSQSSVGPLQAGPVHVTSSNSATAAIRNSSKIFQFTLESLALEYSPLSCQVSS